MLAFKMLEVEFYFSHVFLNISTWNQVFISRNTFFLVVDTNQDNGNLSS